MQKIIVLMPGRLSEFIPALAVLTDKKHETPVEITLIVQEYLIPLCKMLCSYTVVPFRRESKRELESFVVSLQKDTFERLYNCSQTQIAAWISKRIKAVIKRSISDFSVKKIRPTGVVFENQDENMTGISNNYAQFVDMPYPEQDQLNISFTKIKQRLKHLITSKGDHLHHITEGYMYVFENYDFKAQLWPGKEMEYDPEYSGMIALCPGNVRGDGRQWPYFRDIVRLLPSEEFVILGTEYDSEIAKLVAPHFPHRVRNLAGKVTLDETASVMAGASVVVSNDSGLLQLAGFLSVPSVGIFGASPVQRNKPLGTNTRFVISDVQCAPCNKIVCNKMDDFCIRKIIAGSVVNEILAWRSETQFITGETATG